MATAREFTVEELKKHRTKNDCWLAINGKVYDVTPFMDEHPGGPEVMLDSTGRDATQDFDDVGHSDEARKMLEKYLIGVYNGPSGASSKKDDVKRSKPEGTESSGLSKIALPLLVVAAAVVAKYVFKLW
eukprot:tig00000203_g17119.t1